MHPVLFDVGGFAIHSYGALSAVGFVVVVFLVLRRTRALGYPTDHVVDVIFWSALAGLAGSRALFVLQNPAAAPTPADWINVRAGGLVFYGAFLTGLPAAFLVMWYRKLPMIKVLDVFSAALPLGHAFSRLGCFAAGCCYGRPTHLPWAVRFHAAHSEAPQDVPLHPTQLYEAVGLVLVAGVANVVIARPGPDGRVAVAWIGGYAAVRFVVELFRGDERGQFLGTALSTSQGLSVVGAVVAIGAAVALARRA